MDNYSRAAILIDIYGSLLTEKQFNALCLYFNEDCSLFEIAEKMGISRQAAHDIIKRSMNLLEEYELNLGIYSKLIINRKNENVIKKLLIENKVNEALSLVHDIVEN